MECKSKPQKHLESNREVELIDTLWNVNLTIVPSFGDSAGTN